VRAVSTGACALTGVKLSKVGGPEEAIEIAEVLPTYLSSALDGPVGIAAAVQVAQTLGAASGSPADGLAHGLATQRLFSTSIASVGCELRGDMLHAPEGPGLGVEIDEAALEHLHALAAAGLECRNDLCRAAVADQMGDAMGDSEQFHGGHPAGAVGRRDETLRDDGA